MKRFFLILVFGLTLNIYAQFPYWQYRVLVAPKPVQVCVMQVHSAPTIIRHEAPINYYQYENYDYRPRRAVGSRTSSYSVVPAREEDYDRRERNYARKIDNKKWYVSFHLNSSVLEEWSWNELFHLIDYAKKNTNKKFCIKAYADVGTGTSEGNMKLSTDRSSAVRRVLINEGISIERLFVQDYGSYVQPYNTNNFNRLVEISVYE